MNTENTAESGSPAAADAQFLDEVEVRVLGALAEKEAATPDNYPLSLNAMVNACNQLTSRDPVMSVTEAEVLEAIDRLATKKLVNAIHQAGARVAKYEHRMRIKWMLDQPKVAVLSILMLRGFQTAGEIRSRVGRLHEFATVAEVEKCLDYLIDKYPPLVARLNLTPGTKEPRYAHLLSCDEESLDQAEVSHPVSAGGGSKADRVGQLEAEVAQLKQQVSDLSLQFAEFKKQFE
ncbi:YceH family protein [Undibacterium sp. CY18W]|uniref:YceH family protein n=1 Tax=Undibacterium hunanense TaxID=2762292 RepID=A0ABR6ZLE2_9BURK|nr:YceH family protein [Undibacterium hunanense]MBC3916717.1 YceH family protein [Undibacterium hunanense]